MDPIRIPRRDRSPRRDNFPRYATAVAAIFAVTVVGGRIYLGHQESERRVPAEESALVYECINPDGGRYRQQTPCVFPEPQTAYSGPPAYAPPRPAAPKVNPNQWLLDRADERYQREVQGAARAERRLDRQLAAARASEAHTYADYSCAALCRELRDLQASMRSAYSARQSERFHDRQNAIYKQMQQQDCRACF